MLAKKGTFISTAKVKLTQGKLQVALSGSYTEVVQVVCLTAKMGRVLKGAWGEAKSCRWYSSRHRRTRGKIPIRIKYLAHGYYYACHP